MLNVGYLNEKQTNGKREFHGHINTRELNINIRLQENYYRSSDAAPSHLIFEKVNVADQPDVQIGCAWLKTPNRPDSNITEFLSLTIDDPSFSHSLHVAAFPKGDGKWDVTWRRRQEKKAI